MNKWDIMACVFCRFEKASKLMSDLMKALTSKSWEEAQTYGESAREHFRTVLEDSALK
jgi:hypothetical protein